MGIPLKKSGEEGIIEITKRLSMSYKAFFDEGIQILYFAYVFLDFFHHVRLTLFWKWLSWALEQLKCWNGAGKVPKRMLEKGNFKIQVFESVGVFEHVGMEELDFKSIYVRH